MTPTRRAGGGLGGGRCAADGAAAAEIQPRDPAGALATPRRACQWPQERLGGPPMRTRGTVGCVIPSRERDSRWHSAARSDAPRREPVAKAQTRGCQWALGAAVDARAARWATRPRIATGTRRPAAGVTTAWGVPIGPPPVKRRGGGTPDEASCPLVCRLNRHGSLGRPRGTAWGVARPCGWRFECTVPPYRHAPAGVVPCPLLHGRCWGAATPPRTSGSGAMACTSAVGNTIVSSTSVS